MHGRDLPAARVDYSCRCRHINIKREQLPVTWPCVLLQGVLHWEIQLLPSWSQTGQQVTESFKTNDTQTNIVCCCCCICRFLLWAAFVFVLTQGSGTFLTGRAIKAKYFQIYFIESHIVFLMYNFNATSGAAWCWGGGAGDFFFAPPRCARTRRHRSSAARETECRKVFTRHEETEWHVEQTFSLIKEQRRL